VSSKLPKGWAKTSLDSIAAWGSGGTPSRKNTNYYNGSIPWIKTGELGNKYIEDTSEKITEDAIKNSSAKIFPKGSVAIAMYGATIGKTSILGIDSTTNQACAVGTPYSELTTSEFLYYLLLSEKQEFINQGKGGAQPNISQNLIKNHIIAIPPLNEQKRIAEKLDQLLTAVDACKTRLDKIPTIIKRFRQSVLAAATSGELTEDWREERKLTKQWTVVNVGDIAEVATGKTPLKSNTAYYKNAKIPWLTSAVTGQELVTNCESYISEFAVKDCSLKIFEPGTLLMAMYGEGKTRGQVTEMTFPATINQACAAIIVQSDSILKSYLKIRLKENYEDTRKLASGGNQPNLNLSKVRSINVPLPTMDEQIEIVRRVDALFSVANQLEQKLESVHARIDKLTPSILAKAFRGELVSQAPNDEPAELILTRISNLKLDSPHRRRKSV